MASGSADAHQLWGTQRRWLEDRPIPPRPPRVRDPWNRGKLTKEDADCCQTVASRDPLGRPPIGFCGPDCERRADRDGRVGRG